MRPQAPEDGDEVRAEQIKKPSEVNRDDPSINVVELPPRSPTFKEQVYGPFSWCCIPCSLLIVILDWPNVRVCQGKVAPIT